MEILVFGGVFKVGGANVGGRTHNLVKLIFCRKAYLKKLMTENILTCWRGYIWSDSFFSYLEKIIFGENYIVEEKLLFAGEHT